METTCCKSYDTDDVDAQFIYDNYFCAATDNDLRYELVDFPIKVIWKCVKLGLVKGGSMMDLSFGCSLFQMLSIYQLFNDITILEVNDGSIRDLKKWANGERDACDWAHASKVLEEVEGCSVNCKEMEKDLRCRVKRILKCDLNKANPVDPVILEKTDCLISMYVLGSVSKHLDDYKRKLTSLSSLLKKGGSLFILGGFRASHYIANEQKFNFLTYEEGDLIKIMKDKGYQIQHLEKFEKKSCANFVNFEHIFGLCAVKETED
uniref:Nicotinamide N-methyltransferase n=1 Tax=Leptobrachium leishanense TaxID=445787 RepID=A0A8C5R7H2_9ANUR